MHVHSIFSKKVSARTTSSRSAVGSSSSSRLLSLSSAVAAAGGTSKGATPASDYEKALEYIASLLLTSRDGVIYLVVSQDDQGISTLTRLR